MKRFILTAFVMLFGACAPTMQSSVFLSKKQEMEDIRQECIESTSNEDMPHVAAVNCRFDRYTELLRKADFKDWDSLATLHGRYLDIAMRQDSKKITEAQADQLSTEANGKFYSSMQQRDAIRCRLRNPMEA
jgi:hypothetical protein